MRQGEIYPAFHRLTFPVDTIMYMHAHACSRFVACCHMFREIFLLMHTVNEFFLIVRLFIYLFVYD